MAFFVSDLAALVLHKKGSWGMRILAILMERTRPGSTAIFFAKMTNASSRQFRWQMADGWRSVYRPPDRMCFYG